jgi:hypothetical protein
MIGAANAVAAAVQERLRGASCLQGPSITATAAVSDMLVPTHQKPFHSRRTCSRTLHLGKDTPLFPGNYRTGRCPETMIRIMRSYCLIW